MIVFYLSAILMVGVLVFGGWYYALWFDPLVLLLVVLVADPNNIADYGLRFWEWS